MVKLAPRQSPSVSMATPVKPGFFTNWRKANLMSFMEGYPSFSFVEEFASLRRLGVCGGSTGFHRLIRQFLRRIQRMSDALDDQLGIFDVKVMAPAGRLPQRAVRRDPLQVGLELAG